MKGTFFTERQWFVLEAGGREALSPGGGLLTPPNLPHEAIVCSTFQLVGELGKPLLLAKGQAGFAHWLIWEEERLINPLSSDRFTLVQTDAWTQVVSLKSLHIDGDNWGTVTL